MAVIKQLWKCGVPGRGAPCGTIKSCKSLSLQVLPEKECKAIASQIFAGLAYLNDPAAGRRIIHYDLKPANIMFDHYGEVKITVRLRLSCNLPRGTTISGCLQGAPSTCSALDYSCPL